MPGQEFQTRGGLFGHLLRRSVHIGMILVPWLYFRFGSSIHGLLWALIALVVLLEAARLLFKVQVIGQRHHEVRGISSFAWGAVSLFLVLLYAPKAFAYPIVASCALGDPLLGELRRFRIPWAIILLIGVLFIMGIWWVAGYYFGISAWWAVVMGPLIVAMERLPFRWIDDNATMQLAPLILVFLVNQYL